MDARDRPSCVPDTSLHRSNLVVTVSSAHSAMIDTWHSGIVDLYRSISPGVDVHRLLSPTFSLVEPVIEFSNGPRTTFYYRELT